MASPKYVLRAVKFYCGDESGLDWAGSDEPVWVFTANDEATDGVKTRRSKEFSNVDSHDTRNFDMANSNIIWPQSAAATGAAGPIGVSVQLWEMDHGNADNIAKTTETVLGAAEHVPVVGSWISWVPSSITSKLIGSLVGNDLLGSRTILYTNKALAKKLPNVGSSFTEKFHFSGGSGDIPFELAGAADYDLFLQVKRVA